MQGAPLFIFDKNDYTIKEASIVNVSLPRMSKGVAGNPMGLFQSPVVEITYSLGGENASLEFPVNSLLAEYPAKGWFVSIDKSVVSREIDAEADKAKTQLSLMPKYQTIVDGREALQTQLFPERQAKSAQDDRIAELENKLDRITELLSAANSQSKTKEK